MREEKSLTSEILKRGQTFFDFPRLFDKILRSKNIERLFESLTLLFDEELDYLSNQHTAFERIYPSHENFGVFFEKNSKIFSENMKVVLNLCGLITSQRRSHLHASVKKKKKRRQKYLLFGNH